MYKRCTRPESARRQRHIIACFASLLQTRPYREISIREVCGLAGVPRTAFYRYFDTKDDLLDALIDETLVDLFAQCNVTTLPDLAAEARLREWFLFWKDHSQLVRVLAKNDLSRLLVSRLIKYAQASLLDSQKGRIDLVAFSSLSLRAQTAVGLLYAITEQWVELGMHNPPGLLAPFCRELLRQPLIDIP